MHLLTPVYVLASPRVRLLGPTHPHAPSLSPVSLSLSLACSLSYSALPSLHPRSPPSSPPQARSYYYRNKETRESATATLLRDGNVHVVAFVGGEMYQVDAVDQHAKHMATDHYRRLHEAATLGMVAFKHTDSDHFGALG